MICRLVRNIVLAALIAGGLTACDQLFGPNAASPFRAMGNSQQQAATDPPSNPPSTSSHHFKSLFAKAEPPSDPPMVGNGNFWDHLRADFQLPPADNEPQVQAQIDWFVHNEGYLDRTIRRAAPYMYFILQETQKRNLPGELVLLPIIESAYNPFVSSYRGASGLWQLMPGTAYGLGIKQDWWFDGRRDIYASTTAALDYLTYLQNFFGGDWLLAIAAYDTGEGNVQSAIRRNSMDGRPTDFWSLSLARETRSYVPRLLALAAIIRDPGRYGITLPPISDQPYLQQVDLGVPINLSQAAQLAGMSLAELKQLNPGYSRMTTDPNGPYKLLLPIDRIALFKEQIAALPSITHTTWGRYRVQRGDSLNRIAVRYHTSIAELRETNHLRSYGAPVGRVIMIPTGTESVVPHIADVDMQQVPANTPKPVVAQNTNTINATENNAQQSAAELLNNNNNTAEENTKNTNNTANENSTTENTPDLAADAAALTEQPTEKTYVAQKQIHVIKRGETLMSIARHYNVKVSDLQHWNRSKNLRVLKPGMRIVIEKGSAAPQHVVNEHHESHENNVSNNVNARTYVVRSGDTLVKIAEHEHTTAITLRKFNNLKSSALKPGQVLHLPGSAPATSDASSQSQTMNNKHYWHMHAKFASEHHPTTLKMNHYVVRSGDTLVSIAKHNNVKIADLRKWNRLSHSSLKPGQHLVVYET